jgi:hypothetical protein
MNENISHNFFIWEEKNSTDQNQNLLKNEKSVKESSIIETKNVLTRKDWKDITDPKLRAKMRMKEYYKINRDKIKNQAIDYYKNNKTAVKNKNKVYRETNKSKIKNKNKVYRETNKSKIKIKKKVYYLENIDKIKNYYVLNKDKKKTYYQNNKDKIKIQKKEYYTINRNKIKNYLNSNKDKIREYYKNRKNVDIQFKLSTNLRSRLNIALKSNYKSGSAVKDLGCSIDELKTYLESKFSPGMTWDNWGINGWHIDHIKPLNSFDLTDRNQLLEACHYTNLQPLWAKDNLSKSDNII